MTNDTINVQLKNIEYVVIHTSDRLSNNHQKIYNTLKKNWYTNWQNLIRSELKSDDEFSLSEFDRQDRITALILNDSIVAMHLIGRYTPSDYDSHPYFKGYSIDFLAKLKTLKLSKIQSLQYFWVDPKYSKKITGINFAAILASLSLRHHINEGIDATLTIARRDIRVHETAYQFGFEDLVEPISMHNVPVSQLIVFHPTPYPNPDVEFWAEHYWNTKNTSRNIQNKEAA